MDSQVIKINPEPNLPPDVDIKVENIAEPKDPFDGDLKKIKEFQIKNDLKADGQWGPESEKTYNKEQEK
jgi:hypothetical protein